FIMSESEICRRARKPIQMAIEQGELSSIPEKRLDEAKGIFRFFHEPKLEKRLPVFAFLVGIRNDTAARANLTASIAVDGGGTDRDIEREIPIGLDVADAAAIKPPRPGFQLVDDLHGADFRCTRDGAARKERRKDGIHARFRREPASDGRG